MSDDNHEYDLDLINDDEMVTIEQVRPQSDTNVSQSFQPTQPIQPRNPTLQELVTMQQMAPILKSSGFDPTSRNEQVTLFKMMLAHALGLPWIQAPNVIDVIEGKLSIRTSVVRALALRSGLVAWDRVDHRDPQTGLVNRVTITMWRLDRPHGHRYTTSFGEAEARAQGLVDKSGKLKDNYQRIPDVMYGNRAFMRAISEVCPEVLYGIAAFCGDMPMSSVDNDTK